MVSTAHTTRDLSVESAAEEKFRLAVEACPSGMVMTDGAGGIVLVNAEAERMFGYTRGELIGQKMEMLVPERLRKSYLQRRAALMRHPEPLRLGEGFNLSGRRRDGSEFPVEVGLNPIRTREGLLVLGVYVDMSERRRVERLKDEFVSTVSHELRTPLTSIAGSLGLLIGGAAGTLPEPAIRLLRIAQSNSQRLVRLINDILDIEKIESGQVVFKFKRLSARTLVEHAIEANRGYADGFHVNVRLVDDAATGEVYADPDRLAQVVTNLLSNAIKFSPSQGEVAVAVTECADTVRVAVRDHGRGIPKEFRPRIFEKFAQADATDARRKGGTGLGLSIVKQIVTRLGGTVGFADADGGGTVFYVELPSWMRIAAREIDADASPATARILLCEDDPDRAVALREGLHPFGFKTDFAHSPEDALTRAQSAAYAAIMADLGLPDGDGVNFIRRLRQQPQIYKTPILVMSDGSGDKNDLDASDIFALEYIDKPVNIDDLAQVLDRAVGRGANGRPRILHVDDDRNVLDVVERSLKATATVVSVDSIEEARYALLVYQFDLVILDIILGGVSGLDLLPELRNPQGRPIPVIIFSAHGGEVKGDPQVEASLDKASTGSLKELLAAVNDRLKLKSDTREAV